MPEKIGNGGNGLEDYNPNDGKYVEDGVPNKSYDNPIEEKKILEILETQQYASVEELSAVLCVSTSTTIPKKHMKKFKQFS